MSIFKQAALATIASLSLSVSAIAAPVSITLTSPTSKTGVFDSTYAMGYNYVKPELSLALTGWTYGITETTTNT